MADRRQFLKTSLLGASALAVGKPPAAAESAGAARKPATVRVAPTWDFGVAATNQEAWAVPGRGGHAVEAGVRVHEADLRNHSVGKGGYPDRDGKVTLDASIMDAEGNCGTVAALQHVTHAISVARCVMEHTPHVFLAGDGALQFALAQGFDKENLLTPKAEKAWHEWLKTAHCQPVINSEARNCGASSPAGLPGGKGNRDTIGMLALDAHGKLAGACTTSGMEWKLHGRVGDSPIIGAGLYVDGEVGGATSTGVGEEVIRNAGSFLVVELMRQGRTRAEACCEAVTCIVRKKPKTAKEVQVGFFAMNPDGEVGAWAMQLGFSYAVCDAKDRRALVPSKSVFSA